MKKKKDNIFNKWGWNSETFKKVTKFDFIKIKHFFWKRHC